MSRAILSRARLAAANLTQADLYGANLSDADLQRAALVNGNLRSANLCGANLWLAEAGRHRLDGALFDATTRWPARFGPGFTAACGWNARPKSPGHGPGGRRQRNDRRGGGTVGLGGGCWRSDRSTSTWRWTGIRQAVRPFAKAALFELAEAGIPLAVRAAGRLHDLHPDA